MAVWPKPVAQRVLTVLRRGSSRAGYLAVILLVSFVVACGPGGASLRGTASPPATPSGAIPLAGTVPTPLTASPGATARSNSLPSSTPAGATALSGGQSAIAGAWFVDRLTGWVIGERYQGVRPPTRLCQGAIIHTADGGQSWIDQSISGVLPRKIQFLDARDGWIIGVQGGDCNDETIHASVVLATQDGGAHWTERYRSPLLLTDLAFDSPTSGWLLAQGCTGTKESDCPWQLVSTDDGHTWHQQALPIKAASLDLSHPTAQDGWLVNQGPTGPGSTADTLIVTHDGGRTWVPGPAPSAMSFNRIVAFRDTENGWLLAGGEPGAGIQEKTLYRTSDGGHQWTELASVVDRQPPAGQALPLSGYVGSLDFPTAQDGWIASPRGGLLHTTDGGRDWAQLSNTGLGVDGVDDVHFTDPMDGWISGTHNVSLTSDGGAHWLVLFPVA